MPLGLAARFNLAAARFAGTLRAPNLLRRPRVISVAFEKRPVVGEPVRLQWQSRRAGAAFLRVEQQGAVLCQTTVPVNGVIPIFVLTANPIDVSLELQPIRMRADSEPTCYHLPPVNPVIPRPRFARIEVPNTVLLNGDIAIAWEVLDATGVDLVINDGRNVIQEAVHPSGVRSIRAARAGTWAVRLTAQGTHAAVPVTRFINVTVPVPRIHVDRSVIAGPPGTRGAFAWRMTDAARAFVIAPSREQRSDAPLRGSFAAEVGREVEYFQLVAVGLEGRRVTIELRTEPYPLTHLSGTET